jgi:hypothetical protein
MWSVCCWAGGECNNQPSTQQERQRHLMLGKRATAEGDSGQAAKASTIARWRRLINLDGGRRSRRGVADYTTTNHRQERWRCSDVGRGCSDSDDGNGSNNDRGDRGWRRWRPSSSSMPPPLDQDNHQLWRRGLSPGPRHGTAADDKRGEDAGGGAAPSLLFSPRGGCW